MGEKVIQVTPVIDVDDLTGITPDINLAFQIGDFTVRVIWEEPYTSFPGKEWRFTTSIHGYIKMSANSESEWDKPTVEKAQAFLYDTIFKGIFEDKTLRVELKP
jgi:hypothetical protein